MPAPNDLNDRIAKAKGWTEGRKPLFIDDPSLPHPWSFWRNLEGKPAMRPDFTGTLEGVGGLMRELQEKETEESIPDYDWAMRWSPLFQFWDVWAVGGSSYGRLVQFQSTKEEGFGVAVGRAWMSVHGKEAINVGAE